MNMSILTLFFLWLSSLGPDKIELYAPYCEEMVEKMIIDQRDINDFVDSDHVVMIEVIQHMWPEDAHYQQIYLDFLVFARDFVAYEDEEYRLLLEILAEGSPPL